MQHKPGKMKIYISLLLVVGLFTACSTHNYRAQVNKNNDTEDLGAIEDPDMSIDLTTYLKGMAGVRVEGHGSSAAIYIRGINSLTGRNEPLFVVDGMQFTDYALLYSTLSTANIKRIQVLKTPDEVGYYGVRGANGVIKITTKTGRRSST